MDKYTGRTTSSSTYITSSTNYTKNNVSNSMRLFGLPYQFIETVDPRLPEISESVGSNYIEKIMVDAPTVMIIPGRARFLPGESINNKQGVSHALLEASTGSIESLLTLLSNDKKDALRYYDFEEDYASYMKYVNIMCRTVAAFLEITDYMATHTGTEALTSYDWKNYRWNKKNYSSGVGSYFGYAWNAAGGFFKNVGGSLISGLKGDTIEGLKINMDDLMQPEDTILGEYKAGNMVLTNNFVQFYIDPSSGSSQSLNNTTTTSQIKTAMDTASSAMKEFQFVANSAGIGMEGLTELTESGLDALAGIGGDGKVGVVMNQILSAGTTVVKGENIILPEVYQSSDYGIDYTIDIHLRTPYGNKYSVYVDVLVPLLHLMALCMPKQSTANSFGSPFLIKAYYPGIFNCNLGIVESMQITKPSSEDAYSVDGLPMEIDVQLRIKDLYSDMSMSPSNEPTLFINNTSLIDYLATLSGLNLITPQLENKFRAMMSAYTSGLRDVDDNIKSLIFDSIERKFVGFMSL